MKPTTLTSIKHVKLVLLLVLYFISIANLIGQTSNETALSIAYTQQDRDRSIRMEVKIEEMGKRFDQIDKRFEQIDRHFDQIDRQFEMMESKYQCSLDFYWEQCFCFSDLFCGIGALS